MRYFIGINIFYIYSIYINFISWIPKDLLFYFIILYVFLFLKKCFSPFLKEIAEYIKLIFSLFSYSKLNVFFLKKKKLILVKYQ